MLYIYGDLVMRDISRACDFMQNLFVWVCVCAWKLGYFDVASTTKVGGGMLSATTETTRRDQDNARKSM